MSFCRKDYESSNILLFSVSPVVKKLLDWSSLPIFPIDHPFDPISQVRDVKIDE